MIPVSQGNIGAVHLAIESGRPGDGDGPATTYRGLPSPGLGLLLFWSSSPERPQTILLGKLSVCQGCSPHRNAFPVVAVDL